MFLHMWFASPVKDTDTIGLLFIRLACPILSLYYEFMCLLIDHVFYMFTPYVPVN